MRKVVQILLMHVVNIVLVSLPAWVAIYLHGQNELKKSFDVVNDEIALIFYGAYLLVFFGVSLLFDRQRLKERHPLAFGVMYDLAGFISVTFYLFWGLGAYSLYWGIANFDLPSSYSTAGKVFVLSLIVAYLIQTLLVIEIARQMRECENKGQIIKTLKEFPMRLITLGCRGARFIIAKTKS